MATSDIASQSQCLNGRTSESGVKCKRKTKDHIKQVEKLFKWGKKALSSLVLIRLIMKCIFV